MSTPVRTREPARESARMPRTMQRWDPLREFHDRLDQLVAAQGANDGTPVAWTPPVDIVEAEDAWIIEAELPGVDRKDITIEVRDNELSITGEIKERTREGILRRRTRRVGEFDFHVMLPGHVNATDISAEMHDGVLTVRVPKPDTARAQRIEVK
jgi:HSP20 family protein